MVLLVIVNALNLASAAAMVAFLARRLWPVVPDRQSRFQLAAQYVRFFVVYGLMANRFNRYQTLTMAHDGNAAVPYLQVTIPELVLAGIYLAAVVSSFVAPRLIQRRWGELPPATLRPYFSDPLSPVWLVCEPLFMRPKTHFGKRIAAQSLGCLVGMICVLGLFNVAITLVIALKNVG